DHLVAARPHGRGAGLRSHARRVRGQGRRLRRGPLDDPGRQRRRSPGARADGGAVRALRFPRSGPLPEQGALRDASGLRGPSGEEVARCGGYGSVACGAQPRAGGPPMRRITSRTLPRVLALFLLLPLALASLASLVSLVSLTHADDVKKIKCGMSFDLKGWSAFYKTAKGTGKITCDNGQSADVTIKVTGGGLTFGKSKTVNGTGTFSSVQSIDELFGAYAAAAAHAGAVKSSEAQALTKGE